MKLKFVWNGLFFICPKKPARTELFSVERAKDRDFYFSKIRNNICVAICDRKGNYINSRCFGED
jgi:hypothetical protein